MKCSKSRNTTEELNYRDFEKKKMKSLSHLPCNTFDLIHSPEFSDFEVERERITKSE